MFIRKECRVMKHDKIPFYKITKHLHTLRATQKAPDSTLHFYHWYYPQITLLQQHSPHAHPLTVPYLQYFPTLKAPTRGPCCVLHTSRMPLLGA